MNKILLWLLFLTTILVITSCDDILEKDISNQQVDLLSPPDSLTSNLLTQSFYWENVDGATQYHMQIVKPSFSYIEQLVLDTLVNKNTLQHSLLPGSYQWRVKALNSAYETTYTTNILHIKETEDISQQIIVLQSPPNYDTTNQSVHAFSWSSLLHADEYFFVIEYNSAVVYENLMQETSIDIDLDAGDRNYLWKVRGQNAFSNTAYSSRNIYIDKQAPNIPVLTFPTQNDSISNSYLTFTWDRGANTGSSIYDSLFVYTDESLEHLIRSKKTLQPSYRDSLGVGSYYWRVKSFDAAGNKGDYSESSHFVIESI